MNLSESIEHFRSLSGVPIAELFGYRIDHTASHTSKRQHRKQNWDPERKKWKVRGRFGGGEGMRNWENKKKTHRCTKQGGKMVFGRCIVKVKPK